MKVLLLKLLHYVQHLILASKSIIFVFIYSYSDQLTTIDYMLLHYQYNSLIRIATANIRTVICKISVLFRSFYFVQKWPGRQFALIFLYQQW